MPYTKKQVMVAKAVKHGFRPTGKAKGFTKDFADLVIEETTEDGRIKRSGPKRKR